MLVSQKSVCNIKEKRITKKGKKKSPFCGVNVGRKWKILLCCAGETLAGLSRSADPEPSQREDGVGFWLREPLGCVGNSLKACAAFTGFQEPSLPPCS